MLTWDTSNQIITVNYAAEQLNIQDLCFFFLKQCCKYEEQIEHKKFLLDLFQDNTFSYLL